MSVPLIIVQRDRIGIQRAGGMSSAIKWSCAVGYDVLQYECPIGLVIPLTNRGGNIYDMVFREDLPFTTQLNVGQDDIAGLKTWCVIDRDAKVYIVKGQRDPEDNRRVVLDDYCVEVGDGMSQVITPYNLDLRYVSGILAAEASDKKLNELIARRCVGTHRPIDWFPKYKLIDMMGNCGAFPKHRELSPEEEKKKKPSLLDLLREVRDSKED